MEAMLGIAMSNAEIYGERMPDAPENTVVMPSGTKAPVIQLPANMFSTYQQLYDVCLEEALELHPGVPMPTYAAFTKNLRKVRPDIKLRQFGKFSTCTVCAFIKEMVNYSGHRGTAKAYWLEKMKEHMGK